MGNMQTRGVRPDGRQARTQRFYDRYWPAHVPDVTRTEAHVRDIVPPGPWERALDAGCGTGVCSLALAQLAGEVAAIDLSRGSLDTARRLAAERGRTNINFQQGSLLNLPFADGSFDLVFSWGVIHHTDDPLGALDELVRVLRPDGTLVLAVYLRTGLTWIHELIRHTCLHLPPPARRAVINSATLAVRLGERMGHTTNVRDDNPRIQSQVEDWYFVPQKHFFSIAEMRYLFRTRGLAPELVCAQTGRFRSSSNFIMRGSKARSLLVAAPKPVLAGRDRSFDAR